MSYEGGKNDDLVCMLHGRRKGSILFLACLVMCCLFMLMCKHFII